MGKRRKYMSEIDQILKRGQKMYEEKIKRIRGASQGDFDGAMPYFRERAKHLLEIDESLDDTARTQMLLWLGEGLPEPQLEHALTRIEHRVTTIRTMDRVASLPRTRG